MDNFNQDRARILKNSQKHFQEVMAEFDTMRREFDHTRRQISTIHNMNEKIDLSNGGVHGEIMEAAIKDLSQRTKEATQILHFLNESYKVWFKINPGVSSL